MKSEERHKLQKNELADSLAKGLELVKPYQNAILGGVILVLVAILLSNWWNGKNAYQQDLANTEFFAALNSKDPSVELITMAEKFRSSPVAVVAALTAADMRLNSGCQSFLSNKAKADSELEDAVNIYAKLLPELHNPNLIAQANFGLARAEECQSKLPEAKKHYEQVVKIQPDGPFGVLAASRLEDLGRPSMKIILDKIAQYKPDAFKNNSDIAGPAPFDPNNMPKEPLIDPESFGKKMNLNPEKKINLKSDELFKDLLPSSGDEPVKTENKDESKKPAAGETPAENPPAQETPAPAEENK